MTKLDKLRAMAESAAKPQSSGDLFIKPATGMKIRLFGDIVQLSQYWNLTDEKGPVSIETTDDDPISRRYHETKDERYEQKYTFLVNALVRGEEDKGMRILRISPHSLKESLLPILEEGIEDFFGADAHDLKISIDTSKPDFPVTKYTAVMKKEKIAGKYELHDLLKNTITVDEAKNLLKNLDKAGNLEQTFTDMFKNQ